MSEVAWDPETEELVLVREGQAPADMAPGERLELGHRRFVKRIREREEEAASAAGAMA